MELAWHDRAFDDLTVRELYAIIELRERVFVVEQACVYLDADGRDQASRHIWLEDAAAILAYARIVPAGLKLPQVSIGRVIIAPEARGRGLGRTLMERALDAVAGAPVALSAQAHLEKFYASLGFARTSDIYDEDGIPHVDMLRLA
jgi:ElaA protein